MRKWYLLVIDIEVDVEDVPETEQQTKHERLHQAVGLDALAGALRHRSRPSLKAIRLVAGGRKRHGAPRPELERRRGGRGEGPGSARQGRRDRDIVEIATLWRSGRRRREAYRIEAGVRRSPRLQWKQRLSGGSEG